MRSLAAATVLAAALSAQKQPAAQEQPAEHLDLAVLYAGVPDHPRTAEWREFLAPRVRAFAAIAAEELTRERAGDFDVVVVDCPPPLVKDDKGQVTRLSVPKAPGVGSDFGRPVIFVGGMAMVPDRLKLKIGWL